MKIAVMGSGGVGGYFGGRLAAAGEEVHFIARRAHLQAMRENGLQIYSPSGDVLVNPVNATDDPASIGPVDVVLFAPKLYDVESTAALCKPLVGPETAVISLLNGLDSEDRMTPILGVDHVCGGVAQIGSSIEAPGVIRHVSAGFASIQFGELPSGTSPRLERFLAACEAAGFDAFLRDDIRYAIWQKFIFLAPFAGICCLVRSPAGVVRDNPATRDLLREAIQEAASLARAEGHAFPDDHVDNVMKMIDGQTGVQKPSMLFDLEKGNRIEVEALNGLIARMSAAKGLDAPVNRVIAAALAPYVEGPPTT
ncbi:MAG: 2-dehydropantoate 2-reductase [Alphaproteobacteria bacterium]